MGYGVVDYQTLWAVKQILQADLYGSWYSCIIEHLLQKNAFHLICFYDKML